MSWWKNTTKKVGNFLTGGLFSSAVSGGASLYAQQEANKGALQRQNLGKQPKPCVLEHAKSIQQT